MFAKQKPFFNARENHPPLKGNCLIDIEKEEISGPYYNHHSSDYSETDEDEKEGLGDGKIGRDRHDLFDK